MELLGIKKITADQVTVKGMDLYANLMLGGENIYEAKKQEEKKMQDLELTFPWFKLAGGIESLYERYSGRQYLKSAGTSRCNLAKKYGKCLCFCSKRRLYGG